MILKLKSNTHILILEIYLALPMLPPNLNWIIREIFCSLYELVDDISAIELSHACKDMIVSNLICPAIISPQKCGVVDNDVRIGNIVNHNLVQIAMIIQMISLREFESPPEEYKEFLSQCRVGFASGRGQINFYAFFSEYSPNFGDDGCAFD